MGIKKVIANKEVPAVVFAEKSLARTIEEAAFSYHVMHIDCSAVVDKESLLALLAAELSFPEYFGQNWDALADCLSDMPDWLDPADDGYVLLFTNAEQISIDGVNLDAFLEKGQFFFPDINSPEYAAFLTFFKVLEDASKTLLELRGIVIKAIFLF
ncbi:MAG: barstar family protein [Elusimicrobiaceae bacterium]